MNGYQIAVEPGAIDRLFAKWDAPDSPGASLAVTINGELAYARGYGAADLEHGLAITPDSVFHVASVSKQFTAACVLMLALEGRVDLDAPVRAYLPYVPDFGVPLSVWQLIHHSSGLRDQWELLRRAGWRMDDVITQDHLLRMVRRQRALNFAPDTEHLYSNTGYTLLAELVAAVTGQSLREFAAKRIFGPLGMTRTLFYDDHEELVAGRADSYAPRPGGGFRRSVLSFANTGATSLHTTALDLARWLDYLGRIEGSDLARLMQTRLRLASGELHTYAGGLQVRELRGLRVIDHTGSDAGFRSYCGRYPDFGLGIAILCNLATMLPAKLAEQVASVLLGDRMAPPPARPVAASPVDLGMNLDDYAGEYITAGTGMVARVSVLAGSGLTVAAGDLIRAELVPCGADRFYAAEFEQTVEFGRGPAGTGVSWMSAPWAAAGWRAKRVLPAPTSTPLEACAGDYYSPELDTVYRLRVQEGGLVLQHQRLAESRLLPVGTGEFEIEAPNGGTVAFADAAGPSPAPSFRLSGTRCRNIVFERISGPR